MNNFTRMFGPEPPKNIDPNILARIKDLEEIMSTTYDTTLDELSLSLARKEYDELAALFS